MATISDVQTISMEMTVFTLKVSILCKLILTVGHKPTYIVSNTYVECSNWN